MNFLDIFNGLGTELHVLWLLLIVTIRLTWTMKGRDLYRQHREMWDEFSYQRRKEQSSDSVAS